MTNMEGFLYQAIYYVQSPLREIPTFVHLIYACLDINHLVIVTGRKLPLDIIQSVAKTNTLKLNTYTDTTKEKKPCSC